MSGPVAPGADAPAANSIGQFWRRFRVWLRPAPISTAAALREFIDQRAAFVAQKCAVDYCRGKTGLASYALFTEKTFLDALEICRWEAYAAVLSDLAVMTEGFLRPHAPAERRPELVERLAALYAGILGGFPLPAHRPQGWGDAIASAGLRLRAVGLGPPQRALDVADHSAKRLFDTLPIHSRMRELDEEVVFGAVRFRMVAVSQEMERRIAAAPLAGALLA